jgi:uncharacterized membrane protein
MKDLLIFALSLLFFDFFFIKFVMKPLYEKHMNFRQISLVFAFLAYLAMASSWGLIKGGVGAAGDLKAGAAGFSESLKKAALVGFVVFGTYAFTLKALFPNYTNQMMIFELLWGVTLFTAATWVTNKITMGMS